MQTILFDLWDVCVRAYVLIRYPVHLEEETVAHTVLKSHFKSL